MVSNLASLHWHCRECGFMYSSVHPNDMNSERLESQTGCPSMFPLNPFHLVSSWNAFETRPTWPVWAAIWSSRSLRSHSRPPSSHCFFRIPCGVGWGGGSGGRSLGFHTQPCPNKSKSLGGARFLFMSIQFADGKGNGGGRGGGGGGFP